MIPDYLDSVPNPGPEDGEVYTIEEFKVDLNAGAIIPGEDGDGYWATADRRSMLNIHNNAKPDWATHVAWFNK